MNFQVNLWVYFSLTSNQNGFDVVYNHFTQRRKGFKDLLTMLNDKYKYDIDYAKGMKKIYEYDYIVTNEG